MTAPRELVLASASPRRLALLQQIGLDARVCVPDVDETPEAGESAQALVQRLAAKKSLAVAPGDAAGSVVLAADTVVLLGQRILGKPADRDDFLATLEQLSGACHQVLTGVAVRAADRLHRVVVVTEVRLGPIGQQEAIEYWRTGEPCDKAGGYAIQGRGARFVEALNGSYSNVVGLPLHETARLLAAEGITFD